MDPEKHRQPSFLVQLRAGSKGKPRALCTALPPRQRPAGAEQRAAAGRGPARVHGALSPALPAKLLCRARLTPIHSWPHLCTGQSGIFSQQKLVFHTCYSKVHRSMDVGSSAFTDTITFLKMSPFFLYLSFLHTVVAHSS